MATASQARPGLLGDFPETCRACWERVPDKGLFLGLLAAWAALFQFLGNSTFGYVDTPSLFGWMYNAYNAPTSEDGHGNLIPFAVAVLLWWKREEILAVPTRPAWGALGLVGLGAFLHVVGYTIQQPRLSIVAFFTGCYGLIGLVWGGGWMRAVFFPFFLFAFCVPLGALAEHVTFPLRMLVSKVSVAFSQDVLGIEVQRLGSMIFDPQGKFRYDVAPACSGIRSLISLFALTTIYGFVAFRTWWKRGLLMLLAVPFAVLGNVVRITCVIIAGEAFGQEAGMFVETKLGFITYLLALGGALAVGHILRDDPEPPASLPAAGALSPAPSSRAT